VSLAAAERVVRALLYEGYALYPYRPSSVKNQRPWTFGGVPPGGSAQTECLIEGSAGTILTLQARFLQRPEGGGCEGAVERGVALGPLRLSALLVGACA
jgi:hypothetical protein